MATQQQIADHLSMSQPQVSHIMERLGIDWKNESLDSIRVTYLRHLRLVAAELDAGDGDSLVKERVLTERVDRELKQLGLGDKKCTLVNLPQLEHELTNMVGAFRTELLVRDDKLVSDLASLYGITVDVTILNQFTYAALEQFGRYNLGGR